MSIANIRLVYVELAQTHPNYGPYGMYEIRNSDKTCISSSCTSISKRRDVLYVCADYLYNTTLVCFLALPSLLHFSILSNCYFILVTVHFL